MCMRVLPGAGLAMKAFTAIEKLHGAYNSVEVPGRQCRGKGAQILLPCKHVTIPRYIKPFVAKI